MSIYDQEGNILGLWDICEWIIETYPEDIFVSAPKEVVALREASKAILDMRIDP